MTNAQDSAPVAVDSIPPQPVPNCDTQGFWDALAAGNIALCRCTDCGTWMHPPLERCRACNGPTHFDTIAGTGAVHSYIVLHRASVPGQGPGPHVLAAIDLDGVVGVRLTGRVVGADPSQVEVGTRVHARIVDVPGGPYRQPEFVVDGSDDHA
ncbi:MAG: Zn-ribbon domain-containing OB-fold protein [Acidimicrobiia bacterium]